MRKLKVVKRNHQRSPILVSVRRPGGDPALAPFVDQTHAWLDEVKRDFRRETREELPGSGVLFACDVLVELHGKEASWEKYDVAAFERWIRARASGFLPILLVMLADLAAFTSYLAIRGRMRMEQAIATQERLLDLTAELDPSVAEALERLRRAQRAAAH